jgi:carboxymethylenebutenolidase
MKKYLLGLSFLFSTVLSSAQHHSCCSASQATLAFAELGNDREFVNAHAEPLPMVYEAKFGNMVSLKTEGGKEARAFEAKSGPGTGKVILLFHEWWGLNDYIIREAEGLAAQTGYTVLALDLFDGKVTTDREQASKFASEIDPNRAQAIIMAGLDYAGKMGKVQTMGWSFGGGRSLQAAILGGDKVVGCVMYYGMPELDTANLAKLEAPVLGIFARKDGFITPALADSFAVKMKEVGKPLEIKFYDAVHAFANPSNPQYDKVATADARKRAIAFLNANFPQPKTPVPQKD